MKDFLNDIYNGFLLRDLLGYILPGSFVLGCILHYISLISGISFYEFIKAIPDNIYVNLFAICLSYACGHFLSGIFFHSRILGRFFKYSPSKIFDDYPDCSFDEAWVQHRSKYKDATNFVSDSMKGHIERHAALLHFTGHFSASLIFVVLYICFLALYSHSCDTLKYMLPFMILFPGIYNHYKRLSLERYLLERNIILSKN